MRMTSKEPSINEEYKEPQNQDGDSNTSIVSTDTLKNKSVYVIKLENT